MKIYLASRYPRREELAGYARDLEDAGYEVTSSWLDGDDEIIENAGEYTSAASQIAQGDLDDVDSADVLISFTENRKLVPYLDAASRGGRHVEFGFARGRGKRLIIVGPSENVFHTLTAVQVFDSWGPEVIEALGEHHDATLPVKTPVARYIVLPMDPRDGPGAIPVGADLRFNGTHFEMEGTHCHEGVRVHPLTMSLDSVWRMAIASVAGIGSKWQLCESVGPSVAVLLLGYPEETT